MFGILSFDLSHKMSFEKINLLKLQSLENNPYKNSM